MPALQVLVAGGGIGGLAGALACAKAGHQVNLFERTAAFAPVGAGIQLGPNVTRILNAWGLAQALQSVAAFPELLQVRDARSGSTLGQLRLGSTAMQRYGAPYATVHRADLHGLLGSAVAATGNVNLHLGRAAQQYESSAFGVSLQFLDGPAQTGDLLVGADGLWGTTRNQLLNDGLPVDTGHVAFRALVQQSALPATLRSNHATVWLGPKLHAVQYPVRGDEWLNLVCLLEIEKAPVDGTTHSPADTSDWDQAANSQLLHRAIAGLCTPLQAGLEAIPAWRKWNLFVRAPMQGPHQMAQGRVALLGDAAHPMLPYLAQGAGMAIEDAAELGRCLSNSDAVATQLQSYAAARWQRNARVQQRASRNGHIFHAQGPVALARNIGMKLLGERLLDMPWLYGEKGVSD